MESEIELRLRRQADLTFLEANEDDSHVAEEKIGADYHFRLRAGIVADWDHDISFGSTIQVQGLWTDNTGDDELDFGLAELYFDIRNIGFLPLSLNIGRQGLNLGRGILISDEENEWAFDGFDLSYNLFPSTLRLLGARRSHLSPDTDLEWIGLISYKYEPATPYLREAEFYAGLAVSENSRHLYPFGARAEFLLTPELETWAEFVFQGGESPAAKSVGTLMLDAGFSYQFPWQHFDPALLTRATYASGTSELDRSDFIPMMDHGIGGIVLRPRLTNIQVYESGISFNLIERATLECSFYRYFRNSAAEGVVGKSGWTYDGLTAPVSANSRDLGWEANLTLEWQSNDHLAFRFIAGLFSFGRAYETVKESEILEAWIEMVWSY